MFKNLFVSCATVFFVSLNSLANDKIYIVPTEDHEIKVMAYNVQNLFDAEHDEGKDDFEFLPINHPKKSECDKKGGSGGGYQNACKKTDWTDEKVEIKLNQIKKSLNAQGDYPDILALSEIENSEVVGRLARLLGYDGFVTTNSPDARGIDLAVLYQKRKLNYLGFKERELKNFKFKTRNLSVAHFKLAARFKSQSVIAVFPSHWPSQRSPTQFRNQVADQLKTFMREDAKNFNSRDYHAIVLGDFNTTNEEKPHPIHDNLLTPGDFGLFDVRRLAEIRRHPLLERMPQATYYYGPKNQWNEFDHIIISANLMDQKGLDIDPFSYRIHAPELVSRTNDAGERIPFRYNHNTKTQGNAGYSDHFAVHVKFVLH